MKLASWCAQILKLNRWATAGAAVGLGAVLIIAHQNCDNVKIAMNPKPVADETSEAPVNLFGELEPVLAVRNTACIMCHAQINGDLISDLGNGDPFFMGTDDQKKYHPDQTYYNPFASKHFIWQGGDWGGSSVMGNIYVPDQVIRDSRLVASYNAAGNAPLDHELTVLDFLKGQYMNPTITPLAPRRVIPYSSSSDISQPGLRGQFISRKTIWIDSPSSDEIKDLMMIDGGETVLAQLGVVVYKAAKTDTLKGLIPTQSRKTYKLYLRNNGTVTCKGDIVIQGTLYLKNLNLDTDAAGCRLYVAGSVFIEGPINYVNGGDSNLQISSSRAIMMGMKTMTARLTQDATTAAISGMRNAWSDQAQLDMQSAIITDSQSIDDLTNDAGPYRLMVDSNEKVLAIMDDFDTGEWAPGPGQSSFPDPSTCVEGIPKPSEPCGTSWTGAYGAVRDQYRKTIDYQHLLLNAPSIHSRYYGTFQGVVIGEDVLFAVDNFKFEKDPVLFRTKLLPLVQDRIFAMSNE